MFGFVLGIPVAVLTHFVTFWWLLPILGVLVGWVTNWVALWMIYEPAEPEMWGPVRMQGLFVRQQHDVAAVYAEIVADEILTVSAFGTELLNGPAVRPHAGADRALDAPGRSTAPRVEPGPRSSWRSGRASTSRSGESFATEPVAHG